MTASYLTHPIFGDPEVAACFSDAAFGQAMVAVEVALAAAEAALGIVPDTAAAAIGEGAAHFDIRADVLAAGTAQAGVPVPALVGALCQALPAEAAAHVHWGATSQDIVDSAMMLSAKAALHRIGPRLSSQIDKLEAASDRFRGVVMAGRTRGQMATPVTLGLRIAYWCQPLIALEAELRELEARYLRVQFGGAAGAQSAVAGLGPMISAGMAAALGLADGPPWHTDRTPVRRLADWLARLVSANAKMARDITLMSRSEIRELSAGGAGGSSTMPHKANPVTAEALLSLERVAVAAKAGLDTSAVHAEERDGAMWPVEWELLPRLMEYAGAALGHGTRLAETLTPDAAAMRRRLEAMPEVMAEAAVFGLAPRLGKPEAQALVKAALADAAPFPQALAARAPEGVDTGRFLEFDTVVPSAQALVANIFAERRRPV